MRRLLRAALALFTLTQVFPSVRAVDRTYFLVLDGPSAAEVALAGSNTPAKAAVSPPSRSPQQRIAEIEAAHVALEPLVELSGGRVIRRFARLANAISVRAPIDAVETLARLPGVVRVDPVQQFTRMLETSVPWVSAPAVWGPSSTNATGKGMRIGIIDSGIDYHHASLGGSGDANDYDNNDPTLIEIGSFPTTKVAGGYDFAGDDFDSSGENGDPVPVEDPDPLDPRANGHGSHVASIAAGNGVLKSGQAYKGPYTSTLAMSQFSVGPGVAPEATLFALKIFGTEGSTSGDLILSALEYALDPDNDGDFSDKLNVVNLSLGGVFEPAGTGDVESTGVNLLSKSGTTVVVAAGNSGNIHFVTGLPANVETAITVANSIDDGATFSTIKVTTPPALAGDYTSVEGDFTPKLSAIGPITAQVVQVNPSDACGTILNAAALKGKIALIDRGTCFFVDKIRRVQTAGAIGVIMVNNVDGPPIPMGGSGNTSDIRIPGVMIRSEDGRLIKSQLANGVTATLAAFAAVARPELADQLDNGSSRGPRLPDSHLKPDIAAPGTSINAVEAGSGVRGRIYSGTSMASPHVAGAAILVKQLHPDWTPLQIKMALMNSAVLMHNDHGYPYPESRIGAGRLHVEHATQLTTLARIDNSSGEVSLSFGSLQLLTPYSATRDVRIFNLSSQTQTYQLSVSNSIVETGVTLTPLVPQITIPANSSGVATVRFDADPNQFMRPPEPTTPPFNGDKVRHQMVEASGQLWIVSSKESIHVPWHSIVRALSERHVTATSIGLPATDTSLVRLPSRGASAHSAPLVAVLQLGTTSPNRNYSDARASGDILAVGAASDYAKQGSIAKTTVSFGFAAAGIWRTPQRIFQHFDIEIDLNNDGRADYTLLNSTSGNLLSGEVDDPQGMTDALLTLVRDNSKTTGNLTAGSPINLLPPTFRDPAPFFNSVAILGAPASAIGLNSSRTSFRYRLLLDGEGFAENSIWISFDAAKPLIDPSLQGQQGTPWFDEASSPEITVNRAAALTAGFGPAKPLQALLLHLHNKAGNQVDLVTFDLNNPDTDGDGRPDVDEMREFGDLAGDGSGDQDRDGMSDADELRAGTDPRDPTSLLKMLPPPDAGGVLRWTSVQGAVYTLERADKPQGPFSFIERNIIGTPPLNSFTDPNPPSATRFYRIRVQ